VNILAVCADPGIPLDSTKGATVHVLDLWRALARQGDQVTGVAAWRGGGIPEIAVPGLSLRPVPSGGAAAADFPSRLRAEARLLAQSLRPDIVWERLALASDLGREVAEEAGVPLVVEVNAPIDEEATRFRRANVPDEARSAQLRLLAAADLVYCVSEALVPYARSRGADPALIRVLPNGVDTHAFAGPRIEPAGRLRVGYVGSFKPWHGVEVLIEAFCRAVLLGADLELVLVGEGPMRSGIEMFVEQSGLSDRVRFYGATPHEHVPTILRGVAIAVAPAPGDVDYYFSPLKVYEYAAAGCAIVAPRAGQVETRFRDGDDCRMVTPGSVAELTMVLTELSRDPDHRRRLGERARQRARREFDWSRVAARLREWTAPLLDGRPA